MHSSSCVHYMYHSLHSSIVPAQTAFSEGNQHVALMQVWHQACRAAARLRAADQEATEAAQQARSCSRALVGPQA